jgi:hypothetical protein
MSVYVISVVTTSKTDKPLSFRSAPVLGAHTNKKDAMSHFNSVRTDRIERGAQVIDLRPMSPIHRSIDLKVIKVVNDDYIEEIKLEKWNKKSFVEK